MSLVFEPYTRANYHFYRQLYLPYYVDLAKIEDPTYRNFLSTHGFLVGDPNPPESMTNSPFFVFAKEGKTVVGAIRADRLSSKLYGEDYKLSWSGSKEIKDVFNREEGYELGVILVHPEYKQKGVGTALFEQLLSHMKEQKVPHLFSWVVYEPKNLPSLAFHSKMGFSKVAHFSSRNSFGISNYQSVLFHRAL